MSCYFTLARPPSYANYPDKPAQPTALDIWMPMKDIPGHPGWQALGWIEYDEPLGFETVWHWSLLPADPVEWANFQFWKEGQDGEYMKGELVAMSDEQLTDWCGGQNLVKAAKILREVFA